MQNLYHSTQSCVTKYKFVRASVSQSMQGVVADGRQVADGHSFSFPRSGSGHPAVLWEWAQDGSQVPEVCPVQPVHEHGRLVRKLRVGGASPRVTSSRSNLASDDSLGNRCDCDGCCSGGCVHSSAVTAVRLLCYNVPAALCAEAALASCLFPLPFFFTSLEVLQLRSVVEGVGDELGGNSRGK